MADNKMATVEETLQELETILDTLGNEDTSLEESIKLYAKAADLIAKSNESIKKAQVEIRQIDEKLEQLRLDDDV